MDHKDFLLLKTLYEEKNITHTATKLFMTQPAVSDRLKRLEKEFKCTLFIRQPRGITFTSEGETLVRFFEENLKQYHDMIELVSSKKTVAGVLRLGCSNVFAKYHLPLLLSDFKTRYPDIEISIKSGFTHDRYKDFLEGKSHLCIVRGNHNWDEQKMLLLQEPLCLFTKIPIDMDNLPNYPYIHYQTDRILQDLLDDWWYTKFNKPPKTILEVDSMDTCLKLINQNLGFSLLSQSCAQDAPSLITIPLTFPNNQPIVRETWMYYRNNYEQLSTVTAFINFINEHSDY